MGASEWLAFGGLISTIILGIIGIMSRLSSNRVEILDRITKNKDIFLEETRKIRVDLEERIDRTYKDFGETLAGFRVKINNIELHMEREFVSKREYDKDQARLFEMIERLGKSIEKRLDKIDEKLEKREQPLPT